MRREKEEMQDGSSPLARGLPWPVPAGGRAGGIIPACAGFTTAGEIAEAVWKDHPRLRGVYWEAAAVVPAECGSSPLARGLRVRLTGAPRTPGIIPACAGFTSGADIHGSIRKDHPRLRGVYYGPSRAEGEPGGSSPLARGLPVLVGA